MIGIVCAFFHTEGKGFYSNHQLRLCSRGSADPRESLRRCRISKSPLNAHKVLPAFLTALPSGFFELCIGTRKGTLHGNIIINFQWSTCKSIFVFTLYEIIPFGTFDFYDLIATYISGLLTYLIFLLFKRVNKR